QANNLRRLVIPNDDSGVSSSAYPCSTLLGGMRSEILRDRLSLPLHGLRVSRYRGEGASPLHQGERNSTSTTSKLSKTSSVSVPHPWLFAISRERIAGSRGTDTSSAPSLSDRSRRNTSSVPPYRTDACAVFHSSVGRAALPI